MDEIEQRRKEHLARLQKNHASDYKERFDKGKSLDRKRREKLSDTISADWNAKQKAKAAAIAPDHGKPLPEGWRDAHWKTLQAMAAEYAGVETKNKDESLTVLESYEAKLAETPAE
jgi:CHASE3 domain sensor protein